ncbi:hypothetical protein HHI36_023396 [Cryptolaemus montrouzieri]|uniref:Uncharacterized protein n=1 Tax=Cryptolaemus montrouzieri TaxID=559131 RepID=A0ABD2PGH2_9CUCU
MNSGRIVVARTFAVLKQLLKISAKDSIMNSIALGDVNKQNSYLGGLIGVLPVMRRGKNEDQTRFNTASFAYRVLVLTDDGVACDVKVMHGISEDKMKFENLLLKQEKHLQISVASFQTDPIVTEGEKITLLPEENGKDIPI